MNKFENMKRDELEAYLKGMAAKDPNEMSDEELADWNEAMACLDEMNAED